MTRPQVHAVLERQTLPDGTPWPMPVVLPVPSAALRAQVGQRVQLRCACCQQVMGQMLVEDLYRYGPEIPSLAHLWPEGDVLLGGAITLHNRHAQGPVEYALSPAQTRAMFAHRGWDRVLGLVISADLQEVLRSGLRAQVRRVAADAIFLNLPEAPAMEHPVNPQDILAAYRAALARVLPADRILLSIGGRLPWGAGAPEAVLTALRLRNFGCSHALLSGEEAPVRRLMEAMGALGIVPVFPHQRAVRV